MTENKETLLPYDLENHPLVKAVKSHENNTEVCIRLNYAGLNKYILEIFDEIWNTRAQSPQPQGNGNDHYMQGYEEGVRDTKEFWIKRNQKETINRARDYQELRPQDADRVAALEDYTHIERQIAIGLNELGQPEFRDMETHNAMAAIYGLCSTDQYALGFEAGKQSRDQEVKELVAALFGMVSDIDDGHKLTKRFESYYNAQKVLLTTRHTNNQGE